MLPVDPDLPDSLREEVGDGLRSVAAYEERSYEFLFVREDVRAEYSELEIRDILEDLIIQGLSTDYLESLFHAGPLDCAMYGFEDAAMFHFVADEHAGLFVSIDRDEPVTLEAVITTCKDAIELPTAE